MNFREEFKRRVEAGLIKEVDRKLIFPWSYKHMIVKKYARGKILSKLAKAGFPVGIERNMEAETRISRILEDLFELMNLTKDVAITPDEAYIESTSEQDEDILIEKLRGLFVETRMAKAKASFQVVKTTDPKMLDEASRLTAPSYSLSVPGQSCLATSNARIMRKCGRSFKNDLPSEYQRALKTVGFLAWHLPNAQQPGSPSFEGLFADILIHRAAHKKVTVFTCYGTQKLTTLTTNISKALGPIPADVIGKNSKATEFRRKV